MKHSLKALPTLLVACAALALSSPAFAQQPPSGGDEASTACTWTFTAGGGDKLLRYCVSSHGNVMQFETPAGIEHIRTGTFIEGYAVCSTSFGVHGWDQGDVESAWGALAFSGLSASGVTVTRTTLDGRLRLEMKFTRDTKEMETTIAVTVTNLTAATIAGVQYSRYADFDRSGAWDRTGTSVWESGAGNGVGTTLNGITFDVPSTTGIETFNNLDRSNDGVGSSNTCATGTQVATPAAGDNTARVTYNIGNLAAGKKKVVTFVYRRQ
jgi:hypothetical protein